MSLVHDLLSRFLDITDQEIYREIENFDTWDGLLSQMDDPGHPKPTRQELIETWMHNRWKLLLHDVSKEAVEADGLLVVHRCIIVLDPKAFVDSILSTKKAKKRRGLGVYWSYNFSSAECYWGASDGTDIIMTGLVSLSAIDIPATVFANFHPDVGEKEREIRIKKGSLVYLTSVSLDENDPRWQFDPAVSLKA